MELTNSQGAYYYDMIQFVSVSLVKKKSGFGRHCYQSSLHKPNNNGANYPNNCKQNEEFSNEL